MIEINIDIIWMDTGIEMPEIVMIKISVGIIAGLKEINQEEKSIMVTIEKRVVLSHSIYAHSRYLTQSESYRHSQMTSHEQRQNEYEYKHYP